LLGNPDILILDEPANGLDPEGIAWLRGFLRHLADNGGTVLLSSHVLSEVQQTVDDVIIISKGELKKQCSLEELVASTHAIVNVKSPSIDNFVAALERDSRFATTKLTRANAHRRCVCW
jgi:ABC-2 type transport system ATP-binding protein